MATYSSIEVSGIFRSARHLPLWVLLHETGLLKQVGISKIHFEFCSSSSVAEQALLEGRIDFISGNHISPYALVARGAPIVSLASPDNSKHDQLVSREPLRSLADLRGKRLGETALIGPDGGYAHTRGNHWLYIKREGLDPAEVEWVELAPTSQGFAEKQMQAMLDGRVDATFVTRTDEYEKHGFHVLTPPPLPMISGPTVTSSLPKLEQIDRLGERLVKAMVLGIYFAKTYTDEAEKVLANLGSVHPRLRGRQGAKLARWPAKPYPDPQGVANAHELARVQYPEVNNVHPLALWDLRYLRDLDASGFIDELYRDAPAAQTPN
jgi:hypothetical protein